MRRVNIKLTEEEQEQARFVRWCNYNGIVCHHSPNEIGGSTWVLKYRAIKMKVMGTSKGFPDLIVYLPKKKQFLIIEMKKCKGGYASKEQKEWLKRFEDSGIPQKVCHGSDEAIAFVKQYML